MGFVVKNKKTDKYFSCVGGALIFNTQEELAKYINDIGIGVNDVSAEELVPKSLQNNTDKFVNGVLEISGDKYLFEYFSKYIGILNYNFPEITNIYITCTDSDFSAVIKLDKENKEVESRITTSISDMLKEDGWNE